MSALGASLIRRDRGKLLRGIFRGASLAGMALELGGCFHWISSAFSSFTS